MTSRTRWLIGGTIALVIVAGIGIAWIAQSSNAPAPSSTPIVEASATPTASVQEEAQTALDDHLTECAESTSADPPAHCGIRIPWGTEFAVVSGIRFRIEALPELVLDGDAFTADGGVLVATVTGTGQDGNARTETYRTENWSVRGDITDADGVGVEVW